jgi:hypothetical protein
MAGRLVIAATASTGAPRAAANTTPLIPGALTSRLPPRSAWILFPLEGI